jgi:hypothetical protein
MDFKKNVNNLFIGFFFSLKIKKSYKNFNTHNNLYYI